MAPEVTSTCRSFQKSGVQIPATTWCFIGIYNQIWCLLLACKDTSGQNTVCTARIVGRKGGERDDRESEEGEVSIGMGM